MGSIVPVAQLDRRVPEAGRIRLGVKTARAMKSIDTFRFTSPHQDLIEQIAQMYGGTAKPWSDDRARLKNQWEVITDSTEINIYLPQNGLSQSYELWKGGGRERYCNGAVCEIMGREEPESVECICHAKGTADCKLYTRLNVILPELPFRGVWRMETKGWNAGHEMPGMFDLIQTLHSSGNLVQSKLSLEHRSDTKGGQKRHFVVPVVSIAESPMAIMAGAAAVNAIASGGAPVDERPALAAVPTPADDDPIEAEVLTPELLEIEDKLHSDAIEFDLDPDRFIAAIKRQADNDIDRMNTAHDKIINGELEPLGFKANGSINWRAS